MLFFPSLSFSLQISPWEVNFGKVKKFYSDKRYILIKNDHTKKIEILGVVNACGLALKLEKKFLDPGDSTEAILFFDAGSPQGSFEEKITIAYKFEDGAINTAYIKVSWYTYPDRYTELSVNPERINLGSILPKEQVVFYFDIINSGNMTATVVAQPFEGLLLNTPINILAGERKRIKGILTIDKVEKAEKKLFLETNDPGNPRLEITIAYDARWDIKEGVYIDIDKAVKKDKGYILPLHIEAGKNRVQLVSIHDVNGNAIVKNIKPVFMFENDEAKLAIELSDEQFNGVKKSYLYLTIGIEVKE